MFEQFKSDLKKVKERDPAARNYAEIILLNPGLHAITIHRIAHRLWKRKTGGKLLARGISHVSRFLTGIEIHPGAKIGKGVVIDHGMGIVIGETAEVGKNCLRYQGVTLGGTGKDSGKRHPTLRENVIVGAGAKVLGAIEVGDNTRIGAGSVVVKNIEKDCTVVGIPGRVIHQSGTKINPLAHSALPDTEASIIRNLMNRIDELEGQMMAVIKELKEKTEAIGAKEDIKYNIAQSLKDKEIIEYLGGEESE